MARVVTEKLDPQTPPLTRRLRLSGDWRLAIRLPALPCSAHDPSPC
jgi:hypothetical protein